MNNLSFKFNLISSALLIILSLNSYLEFNSLVLLPFVILIVELFRMSLILKLPKSDFLRQKQ